MKVSTCYQRKSGNIQRLSRYACRACSRSSAVGAVLYFAYSSCRTIASSFCSNPDEFPRHNHRHRPDDTPPKLQKGHRKFVHFSYSFPFRDGCDDSDGVFDGIIFTVATVAIVAPLILRLLHRRLILPAYRSILLADRNVWPYFHSQHGIPPAACLP